MKTYGKDDLIFVTLHNLRHLQIKNYIFSILISKRLSQGQIEQILNSLAETHQSIMNKERYSQWRHHFQL